MVRDTYKLVYRADWSAPPKMPPEYAATSYIAKRFPSSAGVYQLSSRTIVPGHYDIS